jgi:hypothetical protein
VSLSHLNVQHVIPVTNNTMSNRWMLGTIVYHLFRVVMICTIWQRCHSQAVSSM